MKAILGRGEGRGEGREKEGRGERERGDVGDHLQGEEEELYLLLEMILI